MLQVPSPKVVLASTSDMECGFSRDLFAQWCINGKNTIILTSRAADGTLTSDLVKNGGNRNISLMTGKRVKLSGQELEEHKKKEKEKEKVKGQLITECPFDHTVVVFCDYKYKKGHLLILLSRLARDS